MCVDHIAMTMTLWSVGFDICDDDLDEDDQFKDDPISQIDVKVKTS